MSARKISKNDDNDSREVSYLKHKINELEMLNRSYKETNQKLWKENAKLEKKWLRIKFHECETFPEHVLWGGDGSQYCSICGKQTQEGRDK